MNSLLAVSLSLSTHKPITLELIVDGKSVSMELDTGLGVSLISEQTYKSLQLDHALQLSQVKLKSYASEVILVLGQLKAVVNYKEQQATLTLLVVRGDGLSLFGRDWLAAFHLDWFSINKITHHSLMGVLDQYHSIFKPELGSLQGYQAAQIQVDSLATPPPLPFLQIMNSSLYMQCRTGARMPPVSRNY